MSKDLENGAGRTAQDCICEIKIADDVVANIAGIAATEVEGVAGLVGNITNELMSKVGMRTLQKGVNVTVSGSVVSVKLALIMDYGYNIPVTSKKVQERVKNSIESMTGLEVKDVAIRIAGIDTSGQE
ncbi:MAG: Asp23/Gls24 family envelope stress response protein [Lachnospiraceae bacterium]|nr:Asp23/Gls24 family envelope stress response protein [Lachnospiraceae bacterium]